MPADSGYAVTGAVVLAGTFPIGSEQGMEGSVPPGDKRNVFLITREQKKAFCSDCNRGTHLKWTTDPEARWPLTFRLCQACAKRRGGEYKATCGMFTGGRFQK